MAVTTSGLLPDNAEVIKNLQNIDKSANEILFTHRPFLGMIKKIDDLYGKSLTYLTDLSLSGGVSSDWAVADRNRTNPGSRVQWILNTGPSSPYGGMWECTGEFEINERTLRLTSREGYGAFYEEFAHDLKGLKRKMGERLNHSIYRKAHGGICQITYTPVDTKVVLNVPQEHVSFLLNDEVQFATNVSGAPGALRASGAYMYVVGIKRPAVGGTAEITLATSISGTPSAVDATITGITTGDWILFSGQLNNSILGVQDWIVGSTVTNTPFLQVDRTKDPAKLAGHVYAGSVSIENTLCDAMRIVDFYGSTVGNIMMNPEDLNLLRKELINKEVRFRTATLDGALAQLSYKAMEFEGTPIYSDKDVPRGLAFLLDMTTWELHTNGELASPFAVDGGATSLTSPNIDGKLVRYKTYAQLLCRDPSRNIIAKLPITG
jgi:hypothetical protein